MESDGLDPTLGAILPLIGVVLGVLGSGGINYFLNRRSEARGVRTMARLLVPELEEISRGLEGALGVGKHAAVASLPRARWELYESQLASSLNDGDWFTLETVYTSLRLFEDEAKDADPHDPLHPDDRAHVRLTLDVTLDALARVKRLARDPEGHLAPWARPAYDAYLEAGGEKPTLPKL